MSCITMQLKVLIYPASEWQERVAVHGGELICSNLAVVNIHLYSNGRERTVLGRHAYIYAR